MGCHGSPRASACWGALPPLGPALLWDGFPGRLERRRHLLARNRLKKKEPEKPPLYGPVPVLARMTHHQRLDRFSGDGPAQLRERC